MKRLAFVLASTLFLTLISCQKDQTDNLVGFWRVSEVNLNTGVIGTLTLPVSGNMTFNSDGTGNADYTVTAQSSKITHQGDMNWTRAGNTITVTEGNKTTVYTRTTNEKNMQILTYQEGSELLNVQAEIVLER
ncbi:MAG: lipocalin family protein [Saprospiraceae bacterium]